MTDYHTYSFDEAGRHCKSLGDLSKPVILDSVMDRNFRTFLYKDPNRQLQRDCIWLGAQSQPIGSNNNLKWTWLDGAVTSKHQTFCFYLSHCILNVRKPCYRKKTRGAAAVRCGLMFVDIHYKFKSSQAPKARLPSS